MANKTSLLKEAQKWLSKGQIDKAIAAGEKLVGSYPDSNTYNFLGDLYLKKGDKQKAGSNYHKTAKIYRDEGFSLKALAIFKKILNINPTDADALYSLGELNEEKNIVTDAIKYYLAAADSQYKAKKRDEVQKTYRRILKLAPDNIPLRLKVAELFSKQGFPEDAANEYLEIGKLYEKKNDLDKAKEYFVKSLDVLPNSMSTMLSLSNIAEKSGDIVQAINYVHIATERLGQRKELLQRKVHLLTLKGDYEEAHALLSRLIEDDDSDIEARKLQAELFLKAGEADRAWRCYSDLVDEMVEAEASEEAIEIINGFKDSEPVESRKKLVEVYRRTNDIDSAFNVLTELAGLYETNDQNDEALAAYKDALLMKPDSPAIAQKIEALKGKTGPEEPGTEEGRPLDEVLTEVDVFLRYGLYDEARVRLEPLKMEAADNLDVHLKLKTLYAETHDIEQTVTECIVLAELYRQLGDDASRIAVLKEAYDLAPNDPRVAERLAELGLVPGGAAGAAAGPEPAMGPAEDYSSDLTEAEFYFKQGFYKEAAEIYERLARKLPDNGTIRKRLAEARTELGEAPLEDAPADEPEPVSEAVEGMETLSLEELVSSEEDGSGGLDSGVLEVFEEFKKGLEEQVEAEDTETHYNLGIAYKEMGLLDDAISTFQQAQHDPKYFVQASAMLGNCYMEKGLYSLAAEAFSSVLMKTDPKDDSRWSIKYELAEAYEKDGKTDEALGYYTEVYGWDSSFREVAQKINALKKTAKAEEPAEAGEPGDRPKKKLTLKDRKSRVSYI